MNSMGKVAVILMIAGIAAIATLCIIGVVTGQAR